MPLDLDLLLAFQTVVDCGGFTRAAVRLNRTQSSISMQIKRLEEQLGRRLLDRSASSIALTADGERLLRHARQLLALSDAALAEFAGTRPAGRVRIGVPADYTAAYLGDLLPFLARAFPDVTVEVQSDLSSPLLDRTRRGLLDLAIVTRLPGMDRGRTIRRSPLVWVAAPGACAPDRRPLPLAMFPTGCYFRDAALAALDEDRIGYRIVYESPSLAGIEAAVAADFAIAAVASDAIPGRLGVLEDGGLPVLPVVEIALVLAEESREPARTIADFLGRNLVQA